MIRTMIVDDDALVRLGLADLLDGDEGIEVVAQAGDGLQAIEQATAHHIDVALVDVRMPRMDGITATTRLRALPHPPKVITLTTFDLDEYVYNALAAGADGFLLKDTDPVEILRAVHLVAAGSAMLHPPRPAASSTASTRRTSPGPREPRPGWTGSPPANAMCSASSPEATPTPTSPLTWPCARAPSKPTSVAF